MKRAAMTLGISLVAIGLSSCDTQRENNSTGGGAYKQGNGESHALGAANGNPGPSGGSDPGGVGPPPNVPSQ